MKAITLRNLPPELVKIIQKRAQEKGSVNRAVISLLEESAGLHKKRKNTRVYHDLDHLAGTWSKKQAAEFDRELARQRKIDPELWH